MTTQFEKPGDALEEGTPAREPEIFHGLRSIVIGSAWMIGARWGMRLIGLVSTVILARLLLPEDFGLVAMGSITLGFVLVFADAGQDFAVIRDQNATHEHFDTAWTMSLCIGAAVAIVLFAIAPLAGLYFHEPRAVAVIRVLALRPLISGFTNVGILNFRKDLQFHKEFLFQVVQKFSVFVIVVVLAVLYRSYWALVFGNIFGEVINVGLSYRFHPHRPKLTLIKLREIWRYSTWMQFAQIGNFLGDRIDQILVGGLAGTTAMGGYNVSQDIASAPTNELIFPIGRASFPVFAKLLKEPDRLADTYVGVLSAAAMISLSTSVGVALVAQDMVLVVLGTKWQWVAPLVAWIAIGTGLLGIARTANMILTVTGSGKVFAVRTWLFVVLLFPAALIGGLTWGSIGVAVARLVAAFLFLPAVFYSVMLIIPVRASQILGRLWRPAIASMFMAVVVNFSEIDTLSSPTARLLLDALSGALTFVIVSQALWMLSGYPTGIESDIARYLSKLWAARPSGLKSTVNS